MATKKNPAKKTTPAKPKKQVRAARKAKEGEPKKIGRLDAAAPVLAMAKEPMTTRN